MCRNDCVCGVKGKTVFVNDFPDLDVLSRCPAHVVKQCKKWAT